MTKIEAQCHDCDAIKIVQHKSMLNNIKRNGVYLCGSCSIKRSIKAGMRPQNLPGFWSKPDMAAKLSIAMASSERHKASRKIASEKIRGEKNGMAKGHSEATKHRMSATRRGRFGPRATAWKGGKSSFTAQIKQLVYQSIDHPLELNGDALINWLVDHPLLVHAEGMTLCRVCHRDIHVNWGSHQPEIQL